MLLLRFFIARPPLSTRRCAPARGRTRVSASSPLPLKQLSACALAHLSRHSDHPDGIPTTPHRSPQALFRSRLRLKSHSAPRPPQTPAAFFFRFFITRPPLSTRPSAPSPRGTRVSASCPLPLNDLSASA